MATEVRRASGFLVTAAGLAMVWCAWNESLALQSVVEGVALGSLCLFLTNRFLLKGQYQDLYRIGLLTVVRYIGVVIVAIFVSGIDAIWITITGRLHVGIIDLQTRIRHPFRKVLVANAITLTPGTVTVECEGDTMKVVWINCVTEDPDEAGEMIKGSFERVLAETSDEQGAAP